MTVNINQQGKPTKLVSIAPAVKFALLAGFLTGLFWLTNTAQAGDPVLATSTHIGLKFTHFHHIKENPVECMTCHPIKDGVPGKPDHEICSQCHTIPLDQPTVKDCFFCHQASGANPPTEEDLANIEVKAVNKPDHLRDLKYDHTRSAAKPQSCAACHPRAEWEKTLTFELFPVMNQAVKANQDLGGAGLHPCTVCHTRLGPKTPPADHAKGEWRFQHGQSADKILAGRCDWCHEEQQCHACHATTKPRSHDQAWISIHGRPVETGMAVCPTQDLAPTAHNFASRMEFKKCWMCHKEEKCQSCHATNQPPSHQAAGWSKTHGLQSAAIGRRQCQICHQENACQSCHQTQAPADHNNFWRQHGHGQTSALARDRCQVCHKEDFCIACHVGNSPQPPRESYHVPGADCLSCHSPAAAAGPAPRPPGQLLHPMYKHGPLPGDSCLKCHQLN